MKVKEVTWTAIPHGEGFIEVSVVEADIPIRFGDDLPGLVPLGKFTMRKQRLEQVRAGFMLPNLASIYAGDGPLPVVAPAFEWAWTDEDSRLWAEDEAERVRLREGSFEWALHHMRRVRSTRRRSWEPDRHVECRRGYLSEHSRHTALGG